MEHGEIQRAAGRTQRSEIRCRRSGIKLISDLRLLPSVMDGFYDLTVFNDLTNRPIDQSTLEVLSVGD